MFKQRSTFVWYGILLFLVAVLALSLPPSPTLLQILHIATREYRLAVMALLFPYALILFSAFYAYNALKDYADHLAADRESEAFKDIANGVRALAWGLALSTFTLLIFGAVANHYHGFEIIQAITNNYVAVAVALIGFTLVSNGTHTLTQIVRARPNLTAIRLLVFVSVLFGAFFTYAVIHNNSMISRALYHLSVYPLIFTIIVPYLYAWFVGLVGTYDLKIYSQRVKGVLYKQALLQLGSGLAIVILGAIATQYISNVYANQASASFATILVTVYAFLIIQTAGYALIATGARRLKKMEEV